MEKYFSMITSDHPGIIPIKFGQIPISGLGEEAFKVFLILFNVKLLPRGEVNIDPRSIIWTTLVKGL